MHVVHKVGTVAALAATLGFAALGFAALAASPARAQGFFHPGAYHHNHVRHAQVRQAGRLNHAAAVAADKGQFRKAAALHHRAIALRSAAKHGY